MGDIPPLPPPPPGPHEPYGPQTPRVRRFLVRLAEQRELVWMAAARAWREPADAGRRRRADRALGAAVKRMGRETARDAVVGPVVQMARRVALALHQEPDEAALEELAEPALAAALAVLVSDELSADVLMALYEPFDGAIPLAELLDESESPTG